MRHPGVHALIYLLRKEDGLLHPLAYLQTRIEPESSCDLDIALRELVEGVGDLEPANEARACRSDEQNSLFSIAETMASTASSPQTVVAPPGAFGDRHLAIATRRRPEEPRWRLGSSFER